MELRRPDIYAHSAEQAEPLHGLECQEAGISGEVTGVSNVR